MLTTISDSKYKIVAKRELQLLETKINPKGFKEGMTQNL